MSLAWPAKDPDAEKEYQIDWSDRFPNDPIAESEFDVPEGLSKGIENVSGGVATVWLSGGTAGETYTVVHRIRTEGDRKDVQSVKLKIEDK